MATASGNLQAQSSVVVGLSERQIDVTGSLSAQSSAVSGISERQADVTGSLSAQSSSISGVAENEVVAESGSAHAQLSSIAVTANVGRTTSVALEAQSSTTSGLAERVIINPKSAIRHIDHSEFFGEGEVSRESSGVLQAQSSTVTGVAENSVVGSGTLTDSSSTVAGVSEREITGSGTPVTGTSSASGTSEREITATGALSVGSSAVAGIAENEVVVESGAAHAQLSTVSGVAERQGDAEGTPKAQASTVASSTEITANGSGTLSDSASEVTGVSERTVSGAGVLSDSSSTATGVTEREIVSVEADLSSDEIGVSAVTGDGEREVVSASGVSQVSASVASGVSERTVNGSGTPQAQSSATTGLAENSIVGSGVLVDGDATLAGVSEREIRSSVALADGSSIVTGVAENEVPAQSGALHAQSSSVVVATEITSNGTGILEDEAVIIAGVAEREITSSGATETGVSTLSGLSERQIDVTGAMDTGSSTVDGLAENSIVGSGVLADGDTVVSGLSERTIVGVNTELSTAEVGISAVTGEAENIIPGSGVLTTGAITVAGVAERQIDVTGAMDTGVSSVTGVTEITSNGTGAIEAQSSVTTGLSERTINGSGTLVSQQETVNGLVERVVLPDNITLQCLTTPSEIAGLAERTVKSEQTSVEAQESQTVSVSERIIVLEEGILTGPDYYRPDEDDANIVYRDEDIEVVGIPYTAGRGMYYLQRDAKFKVIVSGGYRLSADDEYRVWEQDNGDGTYDIIAYNSQFSNWDIWYNQSTSINNRYATDALTGSALDLAISEGLFSTSSQVSAEGTAEREIDTNETTQALQAGSSSTGIADGLPHNAVPGATIRKKGDQAQPSQVSGIAERIVDQDVDDIVVDDELNCTDALIAVQANVGYLSREDALNPGTTLEAHASEVDGLSERVVEDNNIVADLIPTANNEVAGAAERIVTVDAGIDMPDDASEVDGLAEREVVTQSGVEQAQSSAVTGVAERIVENNNITLQVIAQQSSIDAQANITYEGRLSSKLLGSVLFTQVSTVDGTSEREIRSDAVLRPTTENLVTGLSERTVVGVNTALTADEVGVSAVAGVGERTIVEADGTTESHPSQIVGVSERTINATGSLVSADASSAGDVEGIKTGDGVLTTGSVTVTGQSEREIDIETVYNGPATGSGVSYDGEDIVLDLTNPEFDGTYEISPKTMVTSRGLARSAVYVWASSSEYGVWEKDNGDGTYHILTWNTSDNYWYIFEETTSVAFTVPGDGLSDDVPSVVTSNTISIERDVDAIDVAELVSQPSTISGVSERTVVSTSADLHDDAVSIVAAVSERKVIAPETGYFRPTINNIVTGLAEVKKEAEGVLVTTSSLVSSISERTIVQEGDAELRPADNNIVTGVAERLVEASGELDVTESLVDGLAENKITGDGALTTGTSSVAGVAERIVTVDAGIEMPDDVSEVAGLAERIVTVDAGIDMPDDDADVAGIAERVINASGELTVVDSIVSGISERIVTVDAGIDMPDDESVVEGVAGRIVTVDAGIDMPDDDSKISGIAERIITVDAGIDMPDDESKITGVSERIITVTGMEQTDESVVTAVAERIIPSETGAPRAVLSYVSGVAERTVNGFSGIEQVQESTVNGTVERQIDQEGGGVFKPTDNNVVAGVAERVITVDAGIDMPDDVSKVTGTSERTVVIQDGIRHTDDADVSGEGIRASVIVRDAVESDESTIAGIAERIIVQEGDAEFKPTENNIVEGTAEREIRSSADLVTDGNRVIGTSERISVSIFSDLQAQSSFVEQDPDPITIVRHPIGGTEYPQYRSDLQAFSSHTTAVSERKIVQETDGLSTERRLAPNPADPNVSYEDKYLILTGMTDASHDGKYEMLDHGFTVAVSSGNNLQLSDNNDYHVFYRKVAYQDYHVVSFRTNNETWVAFQTSFNPETELTDEVIVPNAQLNGELVASTAVERGGPYKIMKPTDYNVVAGTAERGIENNDISQDLVTDTSLVTGTAERMVAPIEADVDAQSSTVSGLGERILNHDFLGQFVETGPSEVEGAAARHSNGIGVLVSGPSTMGGDAENQIDGEEGIAQVDDASVTGLAERTIVNIPDYDIVEGGGGGGSTTIEFTNIMYPEAKTSGAPILTYTGETSDGRPDLLVGSSGFNGTYLITGKTFVVSTSTQTYGLNTGYMVFEKDNGNGTYDVIAATSGGTWTIFAGATQSVLTKSSGDAVGHSSSSTLWTDGEQRTVTYTSSGSGGSTTPTSKVEAGYSELHGEVTLYPEVEVIRNGSGVSEAQSSTVDGLGVRTSNALDATLLDEDAHLSAAAGDGERKVVVAQGDPVQGDNSTVDAEVERCVKGTGQVISLSAHVSGEAERQTDAEGSIDTDSSVVDGLSERKITAVGVCEAQTCSVVGDASLVRTVQGIEQVEPSVVTGVAERSITVSADLQCTDSKVEALVYTNNLEQSRMHTQRFFRIRKPRVRTIMVRQTPTREI